MPWCHRKAPHWDEGETGRVYSLSADDPPRLEVVLEQGKLGLPNGMAWDMVTTSIARSAACTWARKERAIRSSNNRFHT